MWQLLKNIWKYRKQLPRALEELGHKTYLQKLEDDRYRLKLCYKHRQEEKHSHYSPLNCAYCQALANLKHLREDNDELRKRVSKL